MLERITSDSKCANEMNDKKRRLREIVVMFLSRPRLGIPSIDFGMRALQAYSNVGLVKTMSFDIQRTFAYRAEDLKGSPLRDY